MAKKEGKAGKDTNFTWTDEATALLIQVVIDYKAAKMAKGLDWETVKTKYDEIATRMAKIALKFAAAASPDKRIIKVLIIFLLSSYIFSQSKVRTTYRLAKIRLVCEQGLPGLE